MERSQKNSRADRQRAAQTNQRAKRPQGRRLRALPATVQFHFQSPSRASIIGRQWLSLFPEWKKNVLPQLQFPSFPSLSFPKVYRIGLVLTQVALHCPLLVGFPGGSFHQGQSVSFHIFSASFVAPSTKSVKMANFAGNFNTQWCISPPTSPRGGPTAYRGGPVPKCTKMYHNVP